MKEPMLTRIWAPNFIMVPRSKSYYNPISNECWAQQVGSQRNLFGLNAQKQFLGILLVGSLWISSGLLLFVRSPLLAGNFSGQNRSGSLSVAKYSLQWAPEAMQPGAQIESKGYMEHDAIRIHSDADFVAQGWPGAGTKQDPFRIENLAFRDYFGTCIEVNNTRAFFKIQHCAILQAHWGLASFGITLTNVTNALVLNNTFNKFQAGVFFRNASSNFLCGNYFYRNAYGIYFAWNIPFQSSYNVIANNTFYVNDVYFGHGGNNGILWNVFAACDAFDEGVDNSFDHNFWSKYRGSDADYDGIGDVPYQIQGPSPAQDANPLMGLPDGHFPIITYGVQIYPSVEAGDPILIPFTAIALPPGHIAWEVNDTVHFSIIEGALQNATHLSVGYYPLTITITDDYEQSMTDNITIRVVDNFGPRITVHDSFSLMNWPSHLIFSLQLSASDPSGIDTWRLDNEVLFTITQVGLITSRVVLSEGSYAFTVWVNDTLGNDSSVFLAITVRNILPFFGELSSYLIICVFVFSIIVLVYSVIYLRRRH